MGRRMASSTGSTNETSRDRLLLERGAGGPLRAAPLLDQNALRRTMLSRVPHLSWGKPTGRLARNPDRRLLGAISGWVLLSILMLLKWPAFLSAAEAESSGPRICFITPLGIAAGTSSTLKIRGLKLAGSTGVLVQASGQTLKAEIKEKKSLEAPAGFEVKDVGDSLAVVEVAVPADLAGRELLISFTTPGGTTRPRSLRVLNCATLEEEKEPNDGFREAQPLKLGRAVYGAIGAEKDVDVFVIHGRAGKLLSAEVVAGKAGSMLDGLLTLYDDKGRVLVSSDDGGGSRDPRVSFRLRSTGPYFLTIQDASDRGTPWHAYELSAGEEP